MDANAPTPEPRATRKKATPAFWAVLLLAVAFAVGLRIKTAIDFRRTLAAEATLRGRTFQVEIADTVAKRERGLGGRDALGEGRGMYFPFGAGERWVFWMKDMRFPIDIIWIREGKVVDIHRSVPVPSGQPLETYRPSEPADAVLELEAGMAQEIGLEPGDEVKLRVSENQG